MKTVEKLPPDELAEKLAELLSQKKKPTRYAKWMRRIVTVWVVINAIRFRHRRQLWPLLILAALGVGGWLTQFGSLRSVVAIAILTAIGVVFHLRRRLNRREEWIYALCCLACAGGWLVTKSVTDDRWPNAAGVMLWLVLSLRWWGHHMVRPHVQTPRAPIIELWNEHIRDGNGPMAGAKLNGPVPFEHGDTYTPVLVPYRQTLATAQADLKKWTTALDIRMENMILEEHPDHPESPRLLRLQIITKSPIKETVYFDAPRYENGRILLGPYADGIGEAWNRLYTEDEGSMHSTNLTGGTGVGKTRCMECIAITALAMRDAGQHTVLFYMDGQNGASSPTLYKHATWAVGVDGAMRMLAAVERIAARRQAENRAHELTGFIPSPERPGILVMIDEAHLILTQSNAVRFANLAKSIRKLGIAFFVAAHDSSLKTLFDDSLRAALLAGNGLIMHVNSRVVGNLIPGCDINPADLPRIPGYAVVVGAADSGIRTAPFRNRYSPDEKEKTRAEARGKPLLVPTIEGWFARYPALEVDPGAAKAGGKDYLKRHEVAAAELGVLLRSIHGEADVESDDTASEPAAGETEPPKQQGIDQSAKCADRILALDWDKHGAMDVAQVMSTLGTNLSTTRKALRGLVESGALVKDDSARPLVYRRPPAVSQ